MHGTGMKWRMAIGMALLAVMGCGSSTASVSGTVTLEGTPLTGGSVIFYGKNGTIISAAIGADGSYYVPHAPMGAVSAAVVNFPKRTPGAAANLVAIPAKYYDPTTAGLHYTVTSGRQTIHIRLEP